MSVFQHKVRTPLFPVYSSVNKLLRIWDGESKSAVKKMISSIHQQTGTPQNPVDWSDPDTWIPGRLLGVDKDLALRIWEESDRTVNPRYSYSVYMFINNFDLLTEDSNGDYRLSEKGGAFLDNDLETVREIDDEEGILELLSILSDKPRSKQGDLIPEWGNFLQEYSKFGTASTIKDTLWRRLRNLRDRELVVREGNAYSITEEGLEYLSAVEPGETDQKRELNRAIRSYNDNQREALREKLSEIDPITFEYMISDLLEAMGYDDVVVTKQSGDKGVDVVGTAQSGITTVTEVIQVKRQKNNVGRPILDQLRGALPYHEAIRGTLITISDFSKGCEEAALFPGAAPITLINGNKLIDLLSEHEIGVEKRKVHLNEVDDEYFRSVSQQRLDQPDLPEEE